MELGKATRYAFCELFCWQGLAGPVMRCDLQGYTQPLKPIVRWQDMTQFYIHSYKLHTQLKVHTKVQFTHTTTMVRVKNAGVEVDDVNWQVSRLIHLLQRIGQGHMPEIAKRGYLLKRAPKDTSSRYSTPPFRWANFPSVEASWQTSPCASLSPQAWRCLPMG